MTHLTITVDEDTLVRARARALETGTSVDDVLQSYLEEYSSSLQTRGEPCQMEIHTFAPEPYRVKKPIPIIVRPHEGEFLASFLDANVNASGETAHEAFEAVKALMLDMLDHLSLQPKLGPKLAARLSVLREFIDGP